MEIKIDYAAFDDAAQQLQTQLQKLDKLQNQAAALSFSGGSTSTGHSARAMAEGCRELIAVVDQMSALFSATKQFITEAKATYENTDMGFAAAYEKEA